MTKDVLPGTRNKNYTDQQAIVGQHPGYVVPKALEAAVCIFMQYVSSAKRLYGDNPWTYTRCQEATQGYQIGVGGFSPGGLRVNDEYIHEDVGVGALRK